MSDARGLGLTNLQRIFETSKFVALLSATDSDNDLVFERFAAPFEIIDAGGGLVESPGGEILMIYRNGRWDLPKGKLEPGESIEECALREVHEECGITDLTLGRFLTYTYHIYKLGDSGIIKRTAWYAMNHPATGTLTPQIEEGITEIRWVEQGNIPTYLAQSYATIREVFVAGKKCK